MRCLPPLAISPFQKPQRGRGVRGIGAPRFLSSGEFTACRRNAPPSAMTSGVFLRSRLSGARVKRRIVGFWKSMNAADWGARCARSSEVVRTSFVRTSQPEVYTASRPSIRTAFRSLSKPKRRTRSNRRNSGRSTKGNLLLLLRYRPNQDDRNPALLDRDER